MELHRIRGGTKEALEAKAYTIGVGISLGNKWFSTENIVALVRWALQYTREIVIVYVADSIHSINLEVRNKIPAERAMRRSTTMGKDILAAVEKQISESFSDEDKKRIVYVPWDEIVDAKFKEKLAYLYQLYYEDENFSETIKSIVRTSVAKEARQFTEEQITKLGTYILSEMPELIPRVSMRGIICDAYVYPFDTELTKLIEEIQNGTLFPEIRAKILDTEPKVFLEVR